MDVDQPICLAWSKHTQTAPAIVNGLEAGRQAVVRDLGYAVPIVAVDFFKTALLPPIHIALDVDTIIARLKQAKHITDHDRWTQLFKHDPSQQTRNENSVFRDFQRIATLVSATAEGMLKSWADSKPAKDRPDVRPTTRFVCNPDMTPHSVLRENISKPDCFARLCPDTRFPQQATVGGSLRVLWDDIVVPGEFKKNASSKDIGDNNCKLMWSLNHVMRESLRRRFVFGYTIEDINMRLWFLSRSDALVSEEFNFLTDSHTLVHFLLSVMFADPSRLGYDTTMRRVNVVGGDADSKTVDATPQYDIAVFHSREQKPRWYRTQRLISNIGAEAARGRGTRVWEVIRLDEKKRLVGKRRVLKDCWIDDDRTREGDIIQAIKDSAQTESHRNAFNSYLLTVECHGDVYIDGEKDNTHTLLRRGHLVQRLAWYRLESQTETSEHLNPLGSIPYPRMTIDLDKFIEYDDKSHYRIVFEEMGVSIDKLNSAYKIFVNLCGALQGLQALHQCGWVHRDISMGNILVVDEKPKIVDLEYTKKVADDSKVHQTRTGTECFMPIEIKSRNLEFLPAHATTTRAQDDPTFDADAELQRYEAEEPPQRDTDARTADFSENETIRTPKYNPIHDLEGFWWTSLIVTIYRKVQKKGESTMCESQAALNFHEFMRGAFDVFETRRKIMTGVNYFKSNLVGVHPFLKVASSSLEAARGLLVDAYRAAETNISAIDHTAADDIYPRFRKVYHDVVSDLTKHGNFNFEPMNAQFIRPQAEPTLALASLSLDSRKDQLGKRARDDLPDERDVSADDVFAQASSSAPVKRARRDDTDAASTVSTSAAKEGEHSESTGEYVRTEDEASVA